jgi:hypothetical protein
VTRVRVVGLVLAVALVCVAPAAAQSADPMNPDRPGASNGATTVGAGRLQLEAGGNLFGLGGEDDVFTLPVTLRFGVGRDAELRLESDTLTHQGSEQGLGDLFAGIKWTFSRGNPVLGVMGRVRLPTGSRAFRQDGVTPDLTLLANLELGDAWSLEANVAVAAPRDPDGGGRRAQWIHAATLGRTLTQDLQAFAELAAIGPDVEDGPWQWLADAGLAYAASDDLVLDVDVIVGLSSASPDWGLTGGVSLRF